MFYQGYSGITALHCATYHERLDLTKYCTEHGADVNLKVGFRALTPIDMMFISVAKNAIGLDGTHFIRTKSRIKGIRKYLIMELKINLD